MSDPDNESTAPSAAPTPVGSTSKAGRNLPAAIAVGASLGISLILILTYAPRVWIGVVAVALAVATYEVSKRLRESGLLVPRIPLIVGGQATMWLGWPFGPVGVLSALTGTVLVSMVWLLLGQGLTRPPQHYLRDTAVTIFVACWLPLLASFAILMVLQDQGPGRVLVFLIGVVCSDIGGYVAGVLFGKHPMAPAISPKKSWEGLAGSLLFCVIGCLLTVTLILGANSMIGVLLGLVLVVTGTLGDLIESQVKRDLGNQGHGDVAAGPWRNHGPIGFTAALCVRDLARTDCASLTQPAAIPSPNIWHWPDVYEAENRAQDIQGRVFDAIREVADWADRTVVDVGCGAGFHLPTFARHAQRVIGIEPYEPLVIAAQKRVVGLANVTVERGHAEAVPLLSGVADLVHARTAYFFGRGCGPGILEAMRVLKPGGTLVVVDLDVSSSPYGDWMRADLPKYDCSAVEKYFESQGFHMKRVATLWEFADRRTLRAVLGIEFTKRTAERAFREVVGTTIDVRYRIHWRTKPVGIEQP